MPGLTEVPILQDIARSLGISEQQLGNTEVPLLMNIRTGIAALIATPSGAVWGSITGTLADQTDLNTALGLRLLASNNLSDLANAGTARTNLGLGTIATQAASAVAITGGTIAGLTGLAIQDTSAVQNVTIAAASTTPLTAGRSLTLDLNNASSTLKFTAASTITFPSGTETLAKLSANVFTGVQTLPAGTVSAPSINFGTANSGFYGAIAGVPGITVAGTLTYSFDSASFWIRSNSANILLGSSADARFNRDAANSIQMGEDHATTPAAQTFKAHDVTTGTGASMTIAGGKGSVAGGAVILATSATNGAPVSHLTLSSAGLLTFADAVDMAFNATTGTKIGTATTQKLSLYGVTPVVQAASANQAALSLDVDVTGADLVDKAAINTNFTAIQTLVNQLRTDLVALGAIKGAA